MSANVDAPVSSDDSDPQRMVRQYLNCIGEFEALKAQYPTATSGNRSEVEDILARAGFLNPKLDAARKELARLGPILSRLAASHDCNGGILSLMNPDIQAERVHVRDEALRVADALIRKAATVGKDRADSDAELRSEGVILIADQVVRLVSALRAKTVPKEVFLRSGATEEQRNRAQGLCGRWLDETCKLQDEALYRCDELLAFGGPGMGSQIREWMKRCETSHGQEHDPGDDALLASVIEEVQAIARLARLTPSRLDRGGPIVEPVPQAPAIGIPGGSGIDTNGKGRRGRLRRKDSEAKRAGMLAKVRQHLTLKDDPKLLASEFGVSESTARRWLNAEEQRYLDSRAANADPDEARPNDD